MFKRFIAAAMAVAMMSAVAVTASADTARDYTQYRSDYATANMTENERELYNRLDAAAMEFLSEPIDATYNERQSTYCTKEVLFSDLGFTFEQASHMAFWFIHNNPQYYFYSSSTFGTTKTRTLNGKVISKESYISLGIFEEMANGAKRAEITKTLFGTVDKWIDSVTDDEITTYQKELAINALVIKELDYELNAPYNQSVYSSVINKTTVCAGYSALFGMMCNAAGIDCLYVSSKSHGWNIVKLDDGNWYVTDATWNDTTNISDYMLNCGESTVKYKDDDNSHVYEDFSQKWKPSVSTIDYVVTDYDLTGNRANPNPERILTAADVDGNGRVNSADATMILKMSAGLIPKQGLLGDVNKDEKINAKDATEILKYAAGLPSMLDNL